MTVGGAAIPAISKSNHRICLAELILLANVKCLDKPEKPKLAMRRDSLGPLGPLLKGAETGAVGGVCIASSSGVATAARSFSSLGFRTFSRSTSNQNSSCQKYSMMQPGHSSSQASGGCHASCGTRMLVPGGLVRILHDNR